MIRKLNELLATRQLSEKKFRIWCAKFSENFFRIGLMLSHGFFVDLVVHVYVNFNATEVRVSKNFRPLISSQSLNETCQD